MNKKKLIMIPLLVGMVSGCVYYKPPMSGPTATISFPGSGGLFSYNVFIFQNPYLCENQNKQPSEKFKIPAGKLFTFNVNYMSPGSMPNSVSTCNIAASFIPDAGQKYVGHFYYGRGTHCYLEVGEKIYSKTTKGFSSDLLPVNIKVRKFKTGVLSDYCTDKIAKSYKKTENIK